MRRKNHKGVNPDVEDREWDRRWKDLVDKWKRMPNKEKLAHIAEVMRILNTRDCQKYGIK